MDAIGRFYKGRVDFISMFLKAIYGDPKKDADKSKEAGREMTPALFDAVFNGAGPP